MSDDLSASLMLGHDGFRSVGRDVLPLVYNELRAIAENQLRGERRDHTLQPTALVHEVFLRLARENGVDCRDRARFLRVAVRAMRHILVDHARYRNREKRLGYARKVSLDAAVLPSRVRDFDLLELDESLNALAAHDHRSAEVVQLRFFVGLTNSEIAEVLDVTRRTVERDWCYARAWLARSLSPPGKPARIG